MAFYSDDLLQQLKAHADISAVIQRFLPLKKSGAGRYVGRCPFHDDHSPSMSVNPQLGIYKCFACGAGGDVFKFVMEHEKLDFKAAVEWVANDSGFALPALGAPEKQEVLEERALVRTINELAATWFEEQLSQSETACSYLAGRGITEETRKLFHIGFAPEGREGFLSFASRKGFSPRQLVTAGLAVERETGGIADKFRGRLMFAIQNLTGAVVAFGGRILDTNSKAPKYLNSPETILYSKSDILYGLTHSKQEIAKMETVILVEGYFDLISLFQAGIHNVVAVSGTALTDTHANILSRYAKTAYLVFDSDAAGKKATLRSLEIVLPHAIAPRIFSLSRPNGEKIDPDNFIREKGADAFLEELKNAEDWLSYLAHEKPTTTLEDRAAFINYTKSLIKSIRDIELREQYLRLLSERFNTKANLANVQALNKGHAHKHAASTTPTSDAEPAPPQVPWQSIPSLELRFVTLVLKSPTVWGPASVFFDLEFASAEVPFFDAPLMGELLENGLALYAETGAIHPQILHSKLTPLLLEILENLPDETWDETCAQKEFLESLISLENRTCERLRNALKQVESTDSNMQLRMDIHALSKHLLLLQQKSQKGLMDPSTLFHEILETRQSLMNTNEKI
jgi:DNA primase catalytic core